MYNVQMMDQMYDEYRFIVTIIVFSDDARDVNQVCVT